VNQIVAKLPRVDIRVLGSMLVVEATSHSQLNRCFTRDPRHIDELQILIGMMVIPRHL